jgi:hypothetical protein
VRPFPPSSCGIHLLILDRGSLDDRFSRKGGANEIAARYGNDACVADKLDSEFSERRMVDNVNSSTLPTYVYQEIKGN